MVNIFGLWLVVANINYLIPYEGDTWSQDPNGCEIIFNNSTVHPRINKHSCDEVAAEINKRINVSKVREDK